EQIEFATRPAHFKSGRRGDTDSSRGELSEAVLVEKWLGCSPIAGTSLSSHWSKSGCQLHRLDRYSELGLCRPSNRCRNHHSALLRLAYRLGKHRCRSKSLPSI